MVTLKGGHFKGWSLRGKKESEYKVLLVLYMLFLGVSSILLKQSCQTFMKRVIVVYTLLFYDCLS